MISNLKKFVCTNTVAALLLVLPTAQSGAAGVSTKLIIEGVNSTQAVFDEAALLSALSEYDVDISGGATLGAKISLITRRQTSHGDVKALKGLGGGMGRHFLKAARAKGNSGGDFQHNVHLIVTMSGELDLSSYQFTYALDPASQCGGWDDCGTLDMLVAVTTLKFQRVRKRDGRPIGKARFYEYRHVLKSDPNKARIVGRNEDHTSHGVIFDNVLGDLLTPEMIVRIYDEDFKYKLHVDGSALKIDKVEERKWKENQSPPAWTTLGPSDPLMTAESDDCVDIFFVNNPPSTFSGGNQPFYCIGRCADPMLVNTGF